MIFVPSVMNRRAFRRRLRSLTALPPVHDMRVALAGILTIIASTLATVTEAADSPSPTGAQGHWAFTPPTRPPPPTLEPRHAARARTDVDRFILARLEEHGQTLSLEADRTTLIRRVTLDLTGLPPTPSAVDAFVHDPVPDAYERLVERLLASPAYGERWGQHWLDVARFAETDGFEHDKERPNAWRYRDWVIEALAADMPYDRFVARQIAGDALEPRSASDSIATGFALAGPDMPDINSQDERRHIVLSELTGTIGSAFVGLQFGCAQCHDHKWDPISQVEFYRLRAFFESADLFGKKTLRTDASTPEFAARVLRESPKRAKNASYVRVRGDYTRLGERVEPGVPAALDTGALREATSSSATTRAAEATTRRAGLARWLTSPRHPLFARVMANRIWHHHFGRGLVGTPNDFGTRGERPTHPKLLDWLATEFVRREWSIQAMHRVIVRSAVYRQSSRSVRRASTPDDENRLYARFPMWRLEAEAIRDALLRSAGRLSRTQGGRGVMPPLPPEIRKSIRRDHWKVSDDLEDHHRRSIYLFVRRNLRYPFLEVFDRPDANASCGRRHRTTIAPQALALLNSELTWTAARDTARRVRESHAADPREAIDSAYRIVLGRAPDATEAEWALEFLDETAGRDASATKETSTSAAGRDADRLALLILALFNLSEFVYVQ